MTKENKKKIYEEVMNIIAPIVKKHLLERENYYQMFNIENKRLDETFDNIERDFNEKISKLTSSDINNMCFEYFSWYQSIMQILPKYSINEIFSNEEDFKYNFDKIRYGLINVRGLKPWQVELRDVFNHGEPLAFTKQIFESGMNK